uniref:Neprosin PEP catalytic domain-containing protein n=1 Tax=Aegilops tauschii subsp. strangulata TaxID=200361 RepID=A0A453N2I0_AEGTS|nr:uncharacterized protein LOC109778881 isoform X2 [Aegilops tauschii subsp. strangulata]
MMKDCQAFRVTLLLAYLVLVTRGKDASATEIRMEGGDVVDCVDVNLQQAFNHPLLKDHKIQMEPSSFPNGLNITSPFLHDVFEAHPPIVECPRGTVPILRNSRMKHIAGKLYINGVISKDNQQEVAGIKYYGDVYGARAIINVYEPKVKKSSKDLSATSIQIDNFGPFGLDSIAAGYSVAPNLAGDSSARFHVSWGEEGGQSKSCYDHTCPGFVQVNHNFVLGGRLQPVSVYNGKQYVITVLIYKDLMTKNWWVTYGKDNTPIGYWPNSLFTYLKDKGNFTLWGGYVAGPTASSDSPQMGSGHFATEGYGKAAFVKGVQIVDENGNLDILNVNKALVVSSDSTKYTVAGYDFDKYGMHMYYGGPGNLV